MFTQTTEGSPMKFFLEPVAVCLNYAFSKDRRLKHAAMIGLSGGGWTTTLYSAIDPRIDLSIPVAGSIPLYLRSGGSVGDLEQSIESFYKIAGYPDLYLLGALGTGRRQIQVLNLKDDCCFGRAQHDAARAGLSYEEAVREYEQRVSAGLKGAGPGKFEVQIDTEAPGHMISPYTVDRIIASALDPRTRR
jgi:hypothetical protein